MIAMFIGTLGANHLEVHEAQRPVSRPKLSLVGGTDVAKRELDKQVENIQARRAATTPGQTEFTVAQFCAARGATLTIAQMQSMGKAASRYCRVQGLQIGRVDDELFGEVNAYPTQALDAVSGMYFAKALEMA